MDIDQRKVGYDQKYQLGTRNLEDVGEDIKMVLQISLAYPAHDDVVIYMKLAIKLENKILEYGFFY